MTIRKTKKENTLVISLEGRLDSITALDLREELKTSLDGITLLIFDLKDLEYISSAGLRILLLAQKTMSQLSGEMKVCNINEMVMEIFEVTGFSDFLTIE